MMDANSPSTCVQPSASTTGAVPSPPAPPPASPLPPPSPDAGWPLCRGCAATAAASDGVTGMEVEDSDGDWSCSGAAAAPVTNPVRLDGARGEPPQALPPPPPPPDRRKPAPWWLPAAAAAPAGVLEGAGVMCRGPLFSWDEGAARWCSCSGALGARSSPCPAPPPPAAPPPTASRPPLGAPAGAAAVVVRASGGGPSAPAATSLLPVWPEPEWADPLAAPPAPPAPPPAAAPPAPPTPDGALVCAYGVNQPAVALVNSPIACACHACAAAADAPLPGGITWPPWAAPWTGVPGCAGVASAVAAPEAPPGPTRPAVDRGSGPCGA
jgi:hypothetical protein